MDIHRQSLLKTLRICFEYELIIKGPQEQKYGLFIPIVEIIKLYIAIIIHQDAALRKLDLFFVNNRLYFLQVIHQHPDLYDVTYIVSCLCPGMHLPFYEFAGGGCLFK